MKKTLWLAIAACALVLGVAACGEDEEAGGTGTNGGSELSGTINIDGSSTVAPLSELAAERFQEEHPNVNVNVGTSGTGGGFEKFCAGETDISDASREISPEEEQACEEGGVQYEEITVANDGIVVALNPDNPVQCLTTEQLQQIWGEGSEVSQWSEVDNLEQDFSAELELFGPGTDSGTFDFFTEAINGEEGKQRTEYNNVGEDDNATVRGVSGSEGGMGYFGFSFLQENEDKIKAAEVDDGNGCVAPNEDTIKSGEYQPLARNLFIYPSAEALQRPEVQEFIQFYLNNSEELATEAQYVGLTDEQTQDALDKVERLTTGGGGGGTGTGTNGG